MVVGNPYNSRFPDIMNKCIPSSYCDKDGDYVFGEDKRKLWGQIDCSDKRCQEDEEFTIEGKCVKAIGKDKPKTMDV
jgi:hypothetical protein